MPHPCPGLAPSEWAYAACGKQALLHAGLPLLHQPQRSGIAASGQAGPAQRPCLGERRGEGALRHCCHWAGGPCSAPLPRGKEGGGGAQASLPLGRRALLSAPAWGKGGGRGAQASLPVGKPSSLALTMEGQAAGKAFMGRSRKGAMSLGFGHTG